jgi:amino acid transporter
MLKLGGSRKLQPMPTADAIAQAAPEGLRRQLGLASTTAAVIGGIIAVGIFLTPAGMAKALGSPMWLLAVWLAVGATTLSGALCYGELAGRFPRAGGAYVYLRESYGPRTANGMVRRLYPASSWDIRMNGGGVPWS